MNTGTKAITILCFVASVNSAFAQPVSTELLKFSATDAMPNDNFGTAIDVNAGVLLVGAPSDWDNAIESGSVYVIDLDTGQQLHKILPPDPQADGRFGESIDLSDDYILVGAPHHHCENTLDDCGKAYLFDASTLALIHTFEHETGFGTLDFGISVAIENSTVVIGASRESNFYGAYAGGVYIFDAITGQQLHHIRAHDGSDGDSFGRSVAIEDEIIAVGAPYHDSAGQNGGAVYAYHADTATLIRKITLDQPLLNHLFGIAVSLDDSLLLTGATQPTNPSPQTRGAFLHDVDSGNLIHAFAPSAPSPGDQFGISVDLNNGIAAVGAASAPDGGAIYTFDAMSGNQIATYTSSSSKPNSSLGNAVRIENGHLVSGAFEDDEFGNDSGAVLSFALNASCSIDFNQDGVLDFFDVSLFLQAFNTSDPIADLNADGVFDFFDVSLLLVSFNNGCP